ncbi:8315_t:CDS:2 [Racocetra fulgida]|uniref:8315_t:CDS:1 n=1 Tax=Racocetra fulgida TaxID=60492 RepID=A0A9N9ARN5_9GLOM|nr:8315_t:CDS:2 [Racocetra fulgida]
MKSRQMNVDEHDNENVAEKQSRDKTCQVGNDILVEPVVLMDS